MAHNGSVVQEPLQIGEWLARPSLNLITRGGSEVQVEPKVMDLLVCLAKHAGEVVTLEELIAEVWGGVIVSDGSVYLLISRLRQALEDDQHQFIETIRKRGYRLNAPVRWAGSVTEQPPSRARPIWVGAALVIAGLAALGWVILEKGSVEQEASADASRASQTNRPQPSDESIGVALALRQIFASTSLQEQLSILDGTPELDPEDPRTKGLQAFLYSMSLANTYMARSGEAGDIAATRAAIDQYANEALVQEPGEVMAHLALGNMLFFEWRWSEAEASFERALAVSGGDVSPGFASYVFLSSYLGEHKQAIDISERMIATNPESPYFSGFLGIALANAGQYEAAAEELEHVVEVMPQYWVGRMHLVQTYLAMGLRSEAMRLADRLPVDPYTLMLIGRLQEAEREAESLLQRDRDGEITLNAGQRARAYLVLGDEESALGSLEEAARKAVRHEPEPGFYDLMTLKMNIAGDATLSEPDFAGVLARISGD